MSKDKIVDIINQISKENDFTGGVTNNRIKEIESQLKIQLPESYKWFIKHYGHGGIDGVEILGVSKAEKPPCVRETQKYRKYGLPKLFVVIENCNEWLYCLDTEQMIDGECQVVDWDFSGNIGTEKYTNFIDFFEYRISNMLENI